MLKYNRQHRRKPTFTPFFGYISAIFSRFLAVFWPFSGKGRPAVLRLYHTRRPNMDNVDNMDNTRKKRPDV